ncbi:MAG: S8 family serine peptidase [Syntrophobacteraceae bacterium]
MSVNLKRVAPLVFVSALLLAVFAFSPAYAGKDVSAVLNSLQDNAKLHAPGDILADFLNGQPETAVIVRLRSSAVAEALADQSRSSAQAQSEFTGPGAPTYFNLQDEFVTSQLQATVSETVNRVIGQLGTTGIKVTQRFSYQFGFAAKVTPEALERIAESPEVISIEKDRILEAHLAQGIPLMNAATVRNTYTGSGLSIAICDTGIDTSHPRLGGGGFPNSKVIGGFDTGDNDADPRPDSVNGEAHGTACAGIAAGDTGTVGDYIGGVAPGAKLYAVKISTGSTGSASSSAMIAGWEWCITHKNDDPNNPIMIISTSFGAARYYSTCDTASPAMTTAAANAVAAGITVFASSGNDGYCDSMAWPACISYVISVGAVYDASCGTLAFCVNSGSCAPTKTPTSGCGTGYYATDNSQPDMVASYSNSASFLTLFAPANQAYTADIVGAGGYSSGDYYGTFGGTSAACPYAAGSATVLQQAAKTMTGAWLTPAEVKATLVGNGDAISDSKIAVTKPRINLGRAIGTLISFSAPILAAEPATTTGTQNTISWSAVSVPATTGSSTGTLFAGQSTAMNSASAGMTVPRSVSETSTSSTGRIPGTLPSANVMEDRLEPAEAVLPPGSMVVSPAGGETTMLDAGALSNTTILNETFEGSFPGTGWTLYSSPTWGTVSNDKHGGSKSAWCGGSSLDPAGGYANDMNAWMVYGPFSLADATAAGFSFWYKNKSESGYDKLGWYASIDGTNFYGASTSGDANSWRSQVFDLANVHTIGDLRGQPLVWIAFKFTSDGSVTDTGAYVDDLVITKETDTPSSDLTTYKPSNWNDKLPIGTSQLAWDADHSYTGPYKDNQTLYFNWGSVNQGAVMASGYTVHVEVTGAGGGSWNWTGLSTGPGTWTHLGTDLAVGPLDAGTHTFKVWVDYTAAVDESDETNNYYERTITVDPTAVGYYAECAANADFNSAQNSGWITQTSTTFQNLTVGQTYWYRVKAKYTDESGWSNIEHSQQVASDTTAPTLAVTSHTNNQHVSTSSITLSGTATDSDKGNNGIQQVTVNGTRATGDTATGSGTANWSKSLTLTPGSNSITVIASDNSTNHNSTTQTLTIYYDVPDTTAPTLAVTSHTNNQHVSTSSITLSGTATDSGKGNSGIQQVTVNGTRATGDTATVSGTANWSKSLTLTPGSNSITVIASDNSTNHNSTTQTLTIYYDVPDTTAPTLAVTSHTNNQHVSTSSITLSGTATDSGKGNNGIQQVTVNGTRATGDTATGSGTANWSKSLTLTPGSNSITVIASDNSTSHNSTTQTLTIYYGGGDSGILLLLLGD